jgi:hypothetical protein
MKYVLSRPEGLRAAPGGSATAPGRTRRIPAPISMIRRARIPARSTSLTDRGKKSNGSQPNRDWNEESLELIQIGWGCPACVHNWSCHRLLCGGISFRARWLPIITMIQSFRILQSNDLNQHLSITQKHPRSTSDSVHSLRQQPRLRSTWKDFESYQ